MSDRRRPVRGSDDRPPVRAAGGVVGRDGDHEPEVVLIHRGRHDDWSLPKGKLDDGESFAEAALREVAEETGLRCRAGAELPEVRYEVNGRPKVVRFWAMDPIGGDLAPADLDEVDEVRWVPLAEARELVSYTADRELLDAWAARRR